MTPGEIVAQGQTIKRSLADFLFARLDEIAHGLARDLSERNADHVEVEVLRGLESASGSPLVRLVKVRTTVGGTRYFEIKVKEVY
jgi:hypothetical protein